MSRIDDEVKTQGGPGKETGKNPKLEIRYIRGELQLAGKTEVERGSIQKFFNSNLS